MTLAGEGPRAALVLAGAREADDPLLAGTGLPTKALLPVAGRPMIARVLDALAADGLSGERGWVSGLPPDVLPEGTRAAPAADGPAAALAAALRDGVPLPLLVTTADHALLDEAILASFLAGARASGAALSVGLAERRVIEARFPQAQRTYLRLADAQLSGCNLFYLASPDALRAVEAWRRLEGYRKTPWRIAAALGPSVLLRYALGRLSVDALFARLSRLAGARVAPVLLPQAHAAVDVDKPSDLALAEAVLAGEA